jgi:hypothetical protein
VSRSTPGEGALQISRFEDSPTYELAEVVHRETEIARAVAAAQFKHQFGEPEVINLLSRSPISRDPSTWTPWFNYLDFEVLNRCAKALSISIGVLLDRIVKELGPDNWELLHWRGACYRESDAHIDTEMEMEDLIEKYKAQKLANAKAGGHASNQKQYGNAKAFVRSEWALLNCSVPCDHVPVRSWPLFRAREVMPVLIKALKQELSA